MEDKQPEFQLPIYQLKVNNKIVKAVDLEQLKIWIENEIALSNPFFIDDLETNKLSLIDYKGKVSLSTLFKLNNVLADELMPEPVIETKTSSIIQQTKVERPQPKVEVPQPKTEIPEAVIEPQVEEIQPKSEMEQVDDELESTEDMVLLDED